MTMLIPPCLLLGAASIFVAASAKDVHYDFIIKPRTAVPPFSPDCYTDSDLLLVNDQFPGPTIRANVGDTVHVQYRNMHPSQAVTVHYHGLLMTGQPYSDGSAGISTCAVGPMQSFQHTFVANNAGTHYWHGHSSLDRLDGLQGLLIIEDPNDEDEQALKEMYDEERVLWIQDWYHKSGTSLRTALDSDVWPGLPSSVLINGKGRYEGCMEDPTLPECDEEGCSMENYVPAIHVEADKTYLFRVINAGAFVSLNLAIAEHNMTVVSADGTFVDPFEVTSLEVNVAQRYSVLVTTSQETGSYWIGANSFLVGEGFAYLSYDNSTAPNENYTMPVHDMDGAALDAMLFSKSVTAHPIADALEATPDRSALLVTHESVYPPIGLERYTTNNVSNSLYSPKPLLALAYEAVNGENAAPWPNTKIRGTVMIPDEPEFVWNYSNTPMAENVSEVHSEHGLAVFQFVKGQVVDLVFQNTVTNRGMAGSHAWHLHGHQFYIVGQGSGTFNATTDADSFNFVNPVLRDTFSVWNLGWTAIRFVANNPGAWPFHCTMSFHAVTGMGFTVIISPDMLPAPPPALWSCTMTSVNPEDAKVCMTPEELSNLSTTTSASKTGGSDQEKSNEGELLGTVSGGEVLAGGNGFLLSLFSMLVVGEFLVFA